jgi:hypothetical protein
MKLLRNTSLKREFLALCLLVFSPSIALCKGKVEADQTETSRLGIPPLSKEELHDNLEDLAKTSDTYLPNGVNGGVLFDGVVTKRFPKDRYGQYVWLVRPDHVFLGRDKLSDLVRVTSSTLPYSGVLLKTGHRYRIFALDSTWISERKKEGTYFTWNGNVLKLGKRKR